MPQFKVGIFRDIVCNFSAKNEGKKLHVVDKKGSEQKFFVFSCFNENVHITRGPYILK